jgi:TPR repeat protein
VRAQVCCVEDARVTKQNASFIISLKQSFCSFFSHFFFSLFLRYFKYKLYPNIMSPQILPNSSNNTPPIFHQLFHYSRNVVVKILHHSNSLNRRSTHQRDQNSKNLIEQAENYLFGRNNCQKDLKLSVHLLNKAATQYNNKSAFAVLGFCHEFGYGVSENFKLAEQYYLSACSFADNSHDSDERVLLAISRLAFLRKYGRPGVCIDRIEARKLEYIVEKYGSKSVAWIERAATQDKCPASQYCLGVFYHDGISVPKDDQLAFHWYKLSAEQGNCRGQGILGFCYGEGFGVEKNEAEAMRWYHLAASQGETVSIYNIGYCYEDGIGVEKDMAEAVKWYKLAAERGNAFAQNSLGYCYEDGVGVQENFHEAAKWYKQSADQGYPWAQCNYGYCFQNGIGVDKDPSVSVEWYKKAALQGHARAQHNLGYCKFKDLLLTHC